jgi:hypothetical protein
MLEVLNDPWGLFAMSIISGMVLLIVICAFVISIQGHFNYLSKPKSGATKMCDRELRRRLRKRA